MDEFHPKSSFIELVKYDETAKTMDIIFKTGGIYRYLYVFKPQFDAFKLSNDHGRHYVQQIKGQLRSIPIISKKLGRAVKTPLKANKLKRGLTNGHSKHGHTAGLTGIFRRAGLIPASIRPDVRTRHS